jgi:phosphogluconate dehydratase
LIELDCEAGVLRVLVESAEWVSREPAQVRAEYAGFGRELFVSFRRAVTRADEGAVSLGFDVEAVP